MEHALVGRNNQQTKILNVTLENDCIFVTHQRGVALCNTSNRKLYMQSLQGLYLMQKLQKQSYKMYLKILEDKYSFTQDRALESIIFNFLKLYKICKQKL